MNFMHFFLKGEIPTFQTRGVPGPVRVMRPHRTLKFEEQYEVYLIYINIGGFNFVNLHINL